MLWRRCYLPFLSIFGVAIIQETVVTQAGGDLDFNDDKSRGILAILIQDERLDDDGRLPIHLGPFRITLSRRAEDGGGKLSIHWNNKENKSGSIITSTNARTSTSTTDTNTIPPVLLWESPSNGENFLVGGWADLQAIENRGSFQIQENIQSRYIFQSIDSWTLSQSELLTLKGTLTNNEENDRGIRYNLTFQSIPVGNTFHLRFQVYLERNDTNDYGFTSSSSTSPPNYVEIQFASSSSASSDERYYGFGEQFTHLNLAGHEIPILSQEQGIGRGQKPVTQAVNFISDGSGGTAYTTYYSSPHFLSSEKRGFLLENTEYSVFDLRHPSSSSSRRVSVRLFLSEKHKDNDPVATGRILYGPTPLNLIESLTEYTGRMDKLPDWLNENGVIVGMQGGTEAVRTVHGQLMKRQTPVSAYWIQDWVGRRETMFGSQLWWNWEVDDDLYPGWDQLLSDLWDSANARVLGYVNPFLVDVGDGNKPNAKRNLYREAADLGYLVAMDKPGGEPYMITNTDFDAALVDLTNPKATEWLLKVLEEQVLGAGLRGWMADYGEALPFDGILYSAKEKDEGGVKLGEAVDAAAFHNEYPEAWSRLNQEAAKRERVRMDSTAASSGPDQDDIMYFVRSGYTQSPSATALFWEGDQLTTFDKFDGMESSIVGLLSGGYSGISINHSDIGGYTTFSILGLGVKRSKELFLRWLEMNAFTSIFRTHEGNMPEENVQFYSDDETYDAFDKFAKIYTALAPYRKELFEDAKKYGHPVVRHMALHYPLDNKCHEFDHQFLLGPEILVAPVTEKKSVFSFFRTQKKEVYLPEGTWIHLWTGDEFGDDGNGNGGRYIEVEAPLGQPPVFYKETSQVGKDLRSFILENGFI